MRTVIIHAPIAGPGRAADAVAAWHADLDAELAIADAIGRAEALAYEAASADLVVAAGGDGTIRDVVNGLMRRDPPRPRLAIIPVGTGNDIARNLGLLSAHDSRRAVEDGTFLAMDVIRSELQRDGATAVHYSCLNCGIGLGAQVIRCTTPTVKRVFGERNAYNVGTLRALAFWRSPVMRIVHDQGTFEGRVLFLAAGNGEYEGGGAMRLSPGARMDDGLLNVCLIRHGSKVEVLRNFTRIATGDHIHHHLVDYFTTARLEVTCPIDVEIQTDGDVAGRTPVTVEVVPRAIEVYAPGRQAT